MPKLPTKLIDAGAWLKGCNKSWMYYNTASYIIRNAPTAEVYGQWILTKERSPAVSDEYIVMIAGASKPTSLYYDADEGVWYSESEEGEVTYCVTKWMPLPEPPDRETEEILQPCDDPKATVFRGSTSASAAEEEGKKPNVCYCKGCGAEIVWVAMQSGKRMPCDAALLRCRADDASKKTFVLPSGTVMRGVEAPDGVADFMAHRSHFETCPKAEDFKRRKGEGK